MRPARLIVLATNNPRKARELEALLTGVPLRLSLLKDEVAAVSHRQQGTVLISRQRRAGNGTVPTPPPPSPLAGGVFQAVEVPEPFATFRENACHKARVAARLAGAWALGEDSGLDVDALAGRPGVYSARFAGKGEPDERRVQLLLAMMQGVPADRRTARFHCALALASPSGLLGQWEGICEGHIAEGARGSEGFGFDPVFIADGQTRTNAELTPDEKNAISHRGIAMRRFAADLPGILAPCES